MTAHGGGTRPADSCEAGNILYAKEGTTMNADLWLEFLVIALRLVAAMLEG